jgi:hypothetical protein
MKNSWINTTAVIVSILVVMYWLYTIRREKMEGQDSKAVKYIKEASPEKFINPFIVYGMAKELTDDDEKLAKIIPLVKSGDREALIAYLESL